MMHTFILSSHLIIWLNTGFWVENHFPLFLKILFLSNIHTQCGARTQDQELHALLTKRARHSLLLTFEAIATLLSSFQG